MMQIALPFGGRWEHNGLKVHIAPLGALLEHIVAALAQLVRPIG
jgi:hypothetical protein